jgi:hypothetical protein
MAYAPYEEDEDENLSPVAQPSGAGLSSAGNYGPTQVNNPSGPGKFINFSSYFNANKGQAEGMGAALGDKLEGGAQGAQDFTKKTEKDVTDAATANTLKGPDAGQAIVAAAPTSPTPKIETISVVPDQSGLRKEAAEKAGTVYKGPTQESVAATYRPAQEKADIAGRELAQTSDAAGVKAVQGGTGFDAQLAYVAGGNRLSGLRQKYGGISKAVSDSKNLAVAAANKAQETTKTNAAAWGQRSQAYADADRIAQETADTARNTKAKDAWNAALDGFNQSVDATGPTAVLGEQQSGGHIPTTGERPTGASFAAAMPQYYSHRASPGYIPPYFLEKTFDALSNEEALQMLSMSKSGYGFADFVRQMAKKYGVQP